MAKPRMRNEQVMVKLRMRLRAQRKGRSPEQLSKGQACNGQSPEGTPRPSQGQVTRAAEKWSRNGQPPWETPRPEQGQVAETAE